jgi:hypothetical protein
MFLRQAKHGPAFPNFLANMIIDPFRHAGPTGSVFGQCLLLELKTPTPLPSLSPIGELTIPKIGLLPGHAQRPL